VKKRKKEIILITVFVIIFLIFLSFPKSLSPPTMPTPSQSPSPKYFFSSLLDKTPQTTLIAVGDIMLGRYCNVQMLQNKDFKYPFLKTADFISSADITFGNLEAPIVENCPTTETGMIFCSRPESVEGLKHAGFDILSIANNHILNYGQKGLDQTKSLLAQNNIFPSANDLIVKKTNNINFGFLSFDLLTYPNSPVLKKIKDSVSKVDILIVSLHWGNEYQKKPAEWQKTLAHQAVDAGAKIIIGHHPHVTQPAEKYNNGLVLYSLGNFVFDQPWSEETKKGEIAKIIFEGKEINKFDSYEINKFDSAEINKFVSAEIKSYELFPIYIQNYCQPELLQ